MAIAEEPFGEEAEYDPSHCKPEKLLIGIFPNLLKLGFINFEGIEVVQFLHIFRDKDLLAAFLFAIFRHDTHCQNYNNNRGEG